MFLNDFLNLGKATSDSSEFSGFNWDLQKVACDLALWFDGDVSEERSQVLKKCEEAVVEQLTALLRGQAPNQTATNQINNTISQAIMDWLEERGAFSDSNLIMAAAQLSEKNPACGFILDILQHPRSYTDEIYGEALGVVQSWIYSNHLMARLEVVSKQQFEYSKESDSYELKETAVTGDQAELFSNMIARNVASCACNVCKLYVKLDQKKDLDALRDKLQAVLKSMSVKMDSHGPAKVDAATIEYHLEHSKIIVGHQDKFLADLISEQQILLTDYKYHLYCLDYLKKTTLVFPASLEQADCRKEIEKDIQKLQARLAEVEIQIGHCLQEILVKFIPESDVVRGASSLLQDIRVGAKETLLESLKRMYHMNKSSVFSSIFSLTSYAGGMGMGAVAVSFFMPVLAIPVAVVGAGLGLGLAGLAHTAVSTVTSLIHDWQTFKQNEIEQLYTMDSKEFAVKDLFGKDGTQNRARQQALQAFFINHLKQLHIAMDGGAKEKDIEAAHQLLFYYWKEIKGEYGGKKSEAEIMKFFERAMSVVAALKLDAYYQDTAKLCTAVLTGHDLEVDQLEAQKKLAAIERSTETPPGKQKKPEALVDGTKPLAIRGTEAEQTQYETGARAIVPRMPGESSTLAVRSESSALVVQQRQVESKLAIVSGSLESGRADQEIRQHALVHHQAGLQALLNTNEAVQQGSIEPSTLRLWTIDPFEAIARGDRYQLRHWLDVAKTQVREGEFSEIAGLRNSQGVSLLQQAIYTKNYDALSTLIDVVKSTGVNSENRVEQATAVFSLVAASTGLFVDRENLTLRDFFDLTAKNEAGKGLIECILSIEDTAVRQLMMQDFLAEIKRSAAKLTEQEFDALFNFFGTTAIPRQPKGNVTKATSTVMGWLAVKQAPAIVDSKEVEEACRLALVCADDPKQVEKILYSDYDMVDIEDHSVASFISYRVQFFQKLALDREAKKVHLSSGESKLLDCIYFDDHRALKGLVEKDPEAIVSMLETLEKSGFDVFRIALYSGSARFLEALLDSAAVKIDIKRYPDLLIRFAEMKRFDLVMKYWKHDAFVKKLDIDYVRTGKSVLAALYAQGNVEALEELQQELMARQIDLKTVFGKSLEEYQGVIEPVYNLWINHKKDLNREFLQRLLVHCEPKSAAYRGIGLMIDYAQALTLGEKELEKFLEPHKGLVSTALASAMDEFVGTRPLALTHQAELDLEGEEMFHSAIGFPDPDPSPTLKKNSKT